MAFLFENDDRLTLVELLDRADFRIEEHKFPTTAAFQCVFPVPNIDDVIFQRREQKATELAPRAVGLRINLVLQEVGKKSLHQILGVRRGKTAPPNEAVKRWPVIATELCHGGFSVRGSRGAVCDAKAAPPVSSVPGTARTSISYGKSLLAQKLSRCAVLANARYIVAIILQCRFRNPVGKGKR
jgi:hypothetical protein